MTIYILTNSSFNDRDKDRFGVNFFINKGYKVIVLDVQDYVNSELKHTKKYKFTFEANMEVVNCERLKDVENILHINKSGIAFIYLSNNYQSIKITKLLQKFKIKTGIVHLGIIPPLNNSKKTSFVVIDKFKNMRLLAFIKLVMNKLYYKYFNIKYYDFLITTNYNTSLKNFNFPKPLNIIETHSLDYDVYLKNINKKSLVSDKYIAFLDQNLVSHSDFLRMGIDLNVSEEEYYREINNFFDLLENRLKYKVIIAAHPRGNVENYKLLFNNREVFFGESETLTKYSEFVITHSSTAVSFAIIHEKPIIFFTTNSLNGTILYDDVKRFSSALNQDVINISSVESLQININIDEKKYKNYMQSYIKKEERRDFKLSWEIFNDTYLNKLSKR